MEENCDPQHFFTGALYSNLGNIYFELGQLPRAQKFLNRAVEIKSRAWGADHPVTAQSIYYLGRVYHARKRFKQAESIYLKALEIVRGPYGQEHPRTLQVVTRLKELYQDTGAPDKAAFYANWLDQAGAGGTGD